MNTHRLVSVAVAAAALTGSVALAQSDDRVSRSAQSSSSQSSNVGSSGTLRTQGSVRGDLQKAGFSNIQFIDHGYLVRAKTPDGESVVLVFNALNASPVDSSASGAASSGASGSMSADQAIGTVIPSAVDSDLRHQLQQSGFTGIQIVPTGYVLQATSPSGERVTITISPVKSPATSDDLP